MANTNSYFENMSRLTQAAQEILGVANAFNETISGNQAEVVIKKGMVMPSYGNVLQRLERAENTIAQFTQGKGVVQTDDGTYRKITVDNISRPAGDIEFTEVDRNITTFSVDPNWFFESFQFPRCTIKIDLTGNIDADSDRVYVDRIIIDSEQSALDTDSRNAIMGSTMSYSDMINYLNSKGISYKEDKDEINLPLTYERYVGKFQIIGISLIHNNEDLSETWYYLDRLDCSMVDENGTILNNDKVLTLGNYLRFDNSLFRITGINQTEKRVKLEYNVGYETLNTYDTLEYYNEPFSEKIINVGININEYDVVYVKGVNENFNIVSTNWSNPIVVYTNDLIIDGGTDNLLSYYVETVADFGKRMIADYKEGKLPAYGSLKPNAPVLSEDEVRVVQINTQLEATLDSERYNNITTEIASVKSNITAIRTTISANKDRLIQETNPSNRENIQNSINADTEKMNNLTTQFSSLVEELNTLLTDAGAINYTPKYHVRGFFAIPESRYEYESDSVRKGKESIIGFETLYRYLHVDETGTKLNTFDYTDSSNGLQATGVFTDWNLSVSAFLEKEYNPETDRYEWVNKRTDGTQIAINQIDIPIRNGEKVELKIRSISEAGYPYNPLKSDWSNSIIVSFPDNLTTDDSVTTILNTVKSDMTSVVLQETLSAAGIYTHLVDGNSMYKHNANNIEYTETETDSSGNVTVKTMSVAEKIKSIVDLITRNQNS